MEKFTQKDLVRIEYALKCIMCSRHLYLCEGKLTVLPGSHVDDVCRQLHWLSQLYDAPLSIDFNGVKVVADGRSSDDLVADWNAEMDRRHAEYLASDRYAEMQARMKAEREVSEACAIAAVAGLPTPDWNAIKSGTIDHAKDLGMGQWDSSEMPLMLFPVKWHGFALRTPGLEVETINGDRKVVGRDYLDDDRRYGMLAYGIRLRPRLHV